MNPIKLCSEPRCPNPARPGASMCDHHEREYEKLRSRRRRAEARAAKTQGEGRRSGS
jgi:hypothetical protein